MRQILIIHGGDAYDASIDYHQALLDKRLEYERLKPRQRWKQWLANQLPDDDVLAPEMPNSGQAKYDEWKIMFEKVLPFIETRFVLVGHSLGAVFLVKYLTEHALPSKAESLILLATPFQDESNESLGDFKAPNQPALWQNAKNIHFFHSTDDTVVPYSEYKTYKTLVPDATFHSFDDKFHFIGETFPELLEVIKK